MSVNGQVLLHSADVVFSQDLGAQLQHLTPVRLAQRVL